MTGVGAAVLAATAWVGWQTYQAYSHLTAAAADVTSLQGRLTGAADLDVDDSSATIVDLQHHSGAARSAVDDPLYRLASALPWVGADLDAIREVATSVDALADDVLPPAIAVARTLSPTSLAPRDGTIDLGPIAAAAPTLQTIDDGVRAARDRVAAIPRDGLSTPVLDAVTALSSKLDSAASVSSTAARAGRLVPSMLGADGARTYLVVFQNLAEPRASGGIFGSYALIHVTDGTVTMADGAPTRTLGGFDPATAGLTPDQWALYGPEMGTYPQDVNLTPDFSVAAPLFAGMFTRRTGTAVDGVIAMDPVALSYALAGTGPVGVDDGIVLTSTNVVPTLLSTAYEQFEDGGSQDLRDAFLARASAAAFAAVMSGRGDAGRILAGLTRAADERRVLIWSATAAEQQDLAATVLAGSLATATAGPDIGVFLNDGTGAKLGYYLTNQVAVAAGACTPDGSRALAVTVSLHYDAPSAGLPDFVTGIGVGGHVDGPPYALRTNVMIVAPVGANVAPAAVVDGRSTTVRVNTDESREMGTVTILQEPGNVTEITFMVDSGTAGRGGDDVITPSLRLTPGVNPWQSSVDAFTGCGREPE